MGAETAATLVSRDLGQGLGWVQDSLLPLLLHGVHLGRGHLPLRGYMAGRGMGGISPGGQPG